MGGDSMLALLEKTRMINKLLQNTEVISYKKMAEVLKDVIKANIYIVSSEGELLGYSILDGFECELMIKKVLDVGRFPENYVKWLEQIRETSSNYRLVKNMCAFSDDTKCLFESKYTTVVPIFGNGVRLGTLILGKFKKEFIDSDLLLSEYAATSLRWMPATKSVWAPTRSILTAPPRHSVSIITEPIQDLLNKITSFRTQAPAAKCYTRFLMRQRSAGRRQSVSIPELCMTQVYLSTIQRPGKRWKSRAR